jgi:hypothetical protein
LKREQPKTGRSVKAGVLTLPIGDNKALLFVSQLGFQTLGHLEGIIAHCLSVKRDIKREKVLERLQAHAVGNEG